MTIQGNPTQTAEPNISGSAKFAGVMAKQSLRTGTRIELHGTPALGVAPEQATIARWRKSNDDGTGVNHVRGNPGWHVIKFADGGKLMAHESRFRVIDNR